MNYFTSSIYGLIQGLTEFLPVSSSGHLALLPKLLTIQDPGLAFDLAMHVGTALAIICYFHKEVITIIKEALFLVIKREALSAKRLNALYMVIATFTTGVVALSIKGFAETNGRSSNLIAINLIVFGLIMWIADAKFKQSSFEVMNTKGQWKKAFLIGFFQSFALFPGVSRSGITLTISRFLGLSREEASKFSFLLSLPLILGGALLKLPELMKGSEAFDVGSCLFGILVSFIVGIITIHFFLKFIKRIGLVPFAIYRVLLGVTIYLTL
ncbi:hypothetical protein A9Q84_06380 [Halobacteriovorax marinus]|uniref:Undecaprenyl-diphosphatase n=1 Tax=Halobacteriovorax marinus TaxID=97084 RepID=A0A1Y5FF08_9BACT|nr:hypothetical protein A9Q84_06380 [Halobacteriovorax marinus]